MEAGPCFSPCSSPGLGVSIGFFLESETEMKDGPGEKCQWTKWAGGVCGELGSNPSPGDLDHPSLLHWGGFFLDLCCAGIRTLSPSFLNSKVGIVTPNPYPMGVEHELKESMGILWRNPTPF